MMLWNELREFEPSVLKETIEMFLVIVKSEVAQSYPTLCDPVDCSPPGSSVHGILQARILERVAISVVKVKYTFSKDCCDYFIRMGCGRSKDWNQGEFQRNTAVAWVTADGHLGLRECWWRWRERPGAGCWQADVAEKREVLLCL